MENNKRYEWIDVLKGIGIFFVIAGHLVNYNSVFTRYIFTFHMPLFFFVSGYCFFVTRYKDTKTFLVKKLKTIILPYFSLILLGALFTYFYNKGINVPVKTLIKEIFIYTQPEYFHVGQVWFLFCLFVVEIMYYIIAKNVSNNKIKIAILSLSGIIGYIVSIYSQKHIGFRLPFKIDSAFVALVFYGVGNILREIKLDKINVNIYKVIIPVSFIMNIYFGLVLNKSVNLAALIFNNTIYFYIAAFSGIITYLSISYLIKTDKYIELLGKNSLIIFTTHSFAMFTVIKVMNILLNSSYQLFSLSMTVGIFVTIIVILVEIPTVYIMKKYLPFMYGLKRPTF